MPESSLLTAHHPPLALAQPVAEVVRFFHAQGWCPATSSNFSFRAPEAADGVFWVSRSGLDKGAFAAGDFLAVTPDGRALDTSADIRPSAETLLHALVYARVPDAACVVHTHSINTAVISQLFFDAAHVTFTDYEILKGLTGITTHEARVSVPIFDNHQDMTVLARQIAAYWDTAPITHGFILKNHGIYTWGASPAEAKRQMEVFEYLFDCTLKLRSVR